MSAGAIVNMLVDALDVWANVVIGTLVDMLVTLDIGSAVTLYFSPLEFAVPAPYTVDAPAGLVFNMSIEV